MTSPEGASQRADTIGKGDLVLARSEFDPHGQLELKRVEEVFVRRAPVVELVVRGKIIGTTAEHPFYVVERGQFVPAHALVVGETLLGYDGQPSPLEALRDTGRIADVYNFRIADHHTYFVGCDEWGFSVWAAGWPAPTIRRHARKWT